MIPISYLKKYEQSKETVNYRILSLQKPYTLTIYMYMLHTFLYTTEMQFTASFNSFLVQTCQTHIQIIF